MKRDPTITLTPHLNADAPYQHSRCARSGITFWEDTVARLDCRLAWD